MFRDAYHPRHFDYYYCCFFWLAQRMVRISSKDQWEKKPPSTQKHMLRLSVADFSRGKIVAVVSNPSAGYVFRRPYVAGLLKQVIDGQLGSSWKIVICWVSESYWVTPIIV